MVQDGDFDDKRGRSSSPTPFLVGRVVLRGPSTRVRSRVRPHHPLVKGGGCPNTKRRVWVEDGGSLPSPLTAHRPLLRFLRRDDTHLGVLTRYPRSRRHERKGSVDNLFTYPLNTNGTDENKESLCEQGRTAAQEYWVPVT